MASSSEQQVQDILFHYRLNVCANPYYNHKQVRLFVQLLLQPTHLLSQRLLAQLALHPLLSIPSHLSALLDFLRSLQLKEFQNNANILSQLCRDFLVRHQRLLDLRNTLLRLLYRKLGIQDRNLVSTIFSRWLECSHQSSAFCLLECVIKVLQDQEYPLPQQVKKQIMADSQRQQEEVSLLKGPFQKLFVDSLTQPKNQSQERIENSQKKLEKLNWFNQQIERNEIFISELSSFSNYFTTVIKEVGKVFPSSINNVKEQKVMQLFSALTQDLLESQQQFFGKPLRKQLLQKQEFVKGLFSNALMLYLHIYQKRISLGELCRICDVNVVDFWKFVNQLAIHNSIPESILEDHFFNVEREALLVQIWQNQLFYKLTSSRSTDKPHRNTIQHIQSRLIQHLKFRTYQIDKALGQLNMFERVWELLNLLLDSQNQIFREVLPDQLIICAFYVLAKEDELGFTFTQILNECLKLSGISIKINRVKDKSLKQFYNDNFLRAYRKVIAKQQRVQQPQKRKVRITQQEESGCLPTFFERERDISGLSLINH